MTLAAKHHEHPVVGATGTSINLGSHQAGVVDSGDFREGLDHLNDQTVARCVLGKHSRASQAHRGKRGDNEGEKLHGSV